MTLKEEIQRRPSDVLRNALIVAATGIFVFYATSGVSSFIEQQKQEANFRATIKADVAYIRDKLSDVYTETEATLVHQNLRDVDEQLLGRIESLNGRVSRLENEK